MAQELDLSIGNILNRDTNKPKRESGDFQFTDVALELEKLYSFIHDLRELPTYLDALPEEQKNVLTNLLEQVDHIFNQIAEFKPQEISDPPNHRNDLAGQLKSAYAQVYSYIESLELTKFKATGS